jgi:hypothetical protein
LPARPLIVSFEVVPVIVSALEVPLQATPTWHVIVKASATPADRSSARAIVVSSSSVFLMIFLSSYVLRA